MKESFGEQNNPHNNSIIPDKLNLILKNKEHKQEELQDEETGDIYFKKHYWGGVREMHLREHFISLLVKGIFHSSEMIRIGENDFLSRKNNLEYTQKGELLEKEAEIFLLKTIFGDSDRDIETPNHNIEQDKDGRFSHYDYGSALRGNEFNKIHENSKNAYNIFHEFCKDNNFSKDDIRNFSIQIINKLRALEQAVNDEKFISAILEKTEFQPLYELERIDNTNNIGMIKKIKKYFHKDNVNKDAEDLNFIRVKKLFLKPIKAMEKVAGKEVKK
ncbi:MAG: hypothetical protein KBD14_02820 [Candidatus Pacebacteria bacterium]|nr:hypothetical protein [Candidatus Paceibacterota bacterium]